MLSPDIFCHAAAGSGRCCNRLRTPLKTSGTAGPLTKRARSLRDAHAHRKQCTHSASRSATASLKMSLARCMRCTCFSDLAQRADALKKPGFKQARPGVQMAVLGLVEHSCVLASLPCAHDSALEVQRIARTVPAWRRGRASCAAWPGSPVCAMVRRQTTSATHCKCCTFKSWRGMCTASSYVAAQLPAARMVSPLCARPAVLTFQERADMTALGRVLLVITAACCLVGGVQPQVRQAGRVPWRSRHSAEQRERR